MTSIHLQQEEFSLQIRNLGMTDYDSVWSKMKNYTQSRTTQSNDEVWFTEHHDIYTLGANGNHKHILNSGKIKILKVDRGGQVTYHGPGQIMMYILFDLKKLNLNIRQLISALEQTIVNLMADYSIEAVRNPEAPGVYVNSKKIASVGLRISRGCSYHGLAFNHSVNLKPFQGINTCGFEKLDVTNLECLGVNEDKKIIQEKMVHYLERNINLRHET